MKIRGFFIFLCAICGFLFFSLRPWRFSLRALRLPLQFQPYLCSVNKPFIIFIFLLFASATIAQPTLDTIKNCLKQKPHLFAKIDSRNSFIENSRAKIVGFKAGLNYGKRLHLGVGYNQLFGNSPAFNKEIYYQNSNNLRDSVTAKLRLGYISIHAEYIFYQVGHWQLSMPLEFGIGKTYYKYKLNGKNKLIEENYNFLYEPAISIEYKIIKWIGVGADVGYRFMITNDRKLNANFTSPTYAFKLLIYYSELGKALFPKSKWVQRI